MFTKKHISEWKDDRPLDLLHINISLEKLLKNSAFSFEKNLFDLFGRVWTTLINHKNRTELCLVYPFESPIKRLIVFADHTPDFNIYKDALLELIDALDINKFDIIFISDAINLDLKAKYKLMRMDDNGNEFAVSTFLTKEIAESSLNRHSHLHHKQHYWIESLPIHRE